MRRDRTTAARRAATLAAATVSATALWTTGAQAAGSTISSQEWWLTGTSNYSSAWNTTEGDGVTVAVLGPAIDAGQQDLSGSVLQGESFPANAAGRDVNPTTTGCWSTQSATLIAGHGHPDASVQGRVNGMLGVAPHAKILPLTVAKADTSRLAADPTYLAQAITAAVAMRAKVIDIAVPADPTGPNATLTAAVDKALAAGVIVVAPVGDSTSGADAHASPADIPGVVGVTAVDQSGRPAAFDNSLAKATVAAPGVGVMAGNLGNHYVATHQGTGCASALVAGEAALILSADPTWSSGQVVSDIIDTASGRGARVNASLGYGVIDPVTAVVAKAPAATANPLIPVTASAKPAPGAATQSSGSGSIWMIVIIAVAALAVAVAAFFGFRTLRHRRRRYVLPEPAPYTATGPLALPPAEPPYYGYSSQEWAQPTAAEPTPSDPAGVGPDGPVGQGYSPPPSAPYGSAYPQPPADVNYPQFPAYPQQYQDPAGQSGGQWPTYPPQPGPAEPPAAEGAPGQPQPPAQG